MKPVNVFKRTTDDWYPPYRLRDDGNLVEVSFMQLAAAYENSEGDTIPEQWRVCCWGHDDMGLEKDYSSESEAWATFVQIIGWGYVNQDQLISEFGFYGA